MTLEWYAHLGKLVEGPLAPAGLLECRHAGLLGPATPVWRNGLPDWVEAGELPELAALFAPAKQPREKPVEEAPPGVDVDRGRPKPVRTGQKLARRPMLERVKAKLDGLW